MAEHQLNPIRASVADVAWMQGNWLGVRGEDVIEEHWSCPRASTMMGMFRWIRGSKVAFFELLTIEEDERMLTMRIKHFNPGLKGWEEKDQSVTLDLVALLAERAIWLIRGDTPKWLIYQRTGRGLQAWFEKPDETPDRGSRFSYSLAD